MPRKKRPNIVIWMMKKNGKLKNSKITNEGKEVTCSITSDGKAEVPAPELPEPRETVGAKPATRDDGQPCEKMVEDDPKVTEIQKSPPGPVRRRGRPKKKLLPPWLLPIHTSKSAQKENLSQVTAPEGESFQLPPVSRDQVHESSPGPERKKSLGKRGRPKKKQPPSHNLLLESAQTEEKSSPGPVCNRPKGRPRKTVAKNKSDQSDDDDDLPLLIRLQKLKGKRLQPALKAPSTLTVITNPTENAPLIPISHERRTVTEKQSSSPKEIFASHFSVPDNAEPKDVIKNPKLKRASKRLLDIKSLSESSVAQAADQQSPCNTLDLSNNSSAEEDEGPADSDYIPPEHLARELGLPVQRRRAQILPKVNGCSSPLMTTAPVPNNAEPSGGRDFVPGGPDLDRLTHAIRMAAAQRAPNNKSTQENGQVAAEENALLLEATIKEEIMLEVQSPVARSKNYKNSPNAGISSSNRHMDGPCEDKAIVKTMKSEPDEDLSTKNLLFTALDSKSKLYGFLKPEIWKKEEPADTHLNELKREFDA